MCPGPLHHTTATFRPGVSNYGPGSRSSSQHSYLPQSNSRRAVEIEVRRDIFLRGRTCPDEPLPAPQTGELSRLARQIAALAVFSDRAAEANRDRGGPKINAATALHGQPIRALAASAADCIDTHRRGGPGLRARSHLRVSGYPNGPVYRLTACLAAYALGEEPERGLEEVVERAVSDSRAERTREELWRIEGRAGLHRGPHVDRAIVQIQERIESDIALRLRGVGRSGRRSSSQK
jgi:hypothetical protein